MFRPAETLHADGIEIIVVEQLALDEADRPEDSWTPERVRAFVTDLVTRSRRADPVEVTSPGKFLGDLT